MSDKSLITISLPQEIWAVLHATLMGDQIPLRRSIQAINALEAGLNGASGVPERIET